MRRALLLTAGGVWLALSGAANAVVVHLGPEGPADPTYFASEPASQNGFTLDGISWSLVKGTAETRKGSLAGQYAAPLGMGTSPITGTTYFSVEVNSEEMATWATPQTSLVIYWGSIDGLDGIDNSITVDGITLTGAQLATMGALGLGNQANPKDNQFVTITGLAPFTTVEFADTGKNAFEFSLGSAVPEPSTWAMMMLGFAGLGYAAFRRNTKARALAI
jgi:PEP-CTERM motif